MAKLLVGRKQYLAVDLGCFHEREVEEALSALSETIYPGFVFVPCNLRVESTSGIHRPDFVLVERHYRSWWIGEVEMVSHSLFRHVLPQVRTFRDGVYTSQHAKQVWRKKNSLDLSRLTLLFETERPKVLVVANRAADDWIPEIRAEGAELGIFEMFRHEDTAEFIFRINGYVPEAGGETLSDLVVDIGIPRLLQVLTPSSLPAENGSVISILINGALTDWKVMLHPDKAWLNPLSGHLLMPGVRYELLQGVDGLMRIERKSRYGAL